MKIFGLVKLNNSVGDYLVVANSYENPVDYFKEYGVNFLESGILELDLSLMRGMQSDHYAIVKVENHRILPETYFRVERLDRSALAAAHKYFVENTDIVNMAAIPSTIKTRLLEGYYVV